MENNVQIAGFKFKVDNLDYLLKTSNELSAKYYINPSKMYALQLLNADAIAGYDHILNAVIHAINAFERGENIAKDLGLEICLRASLQRQISKALTIMGLKKGEMNICAVSVNCNEKIIDALEEILGNRDNSVIDPDMDKLKEIYDISETELEIYGSIENLMIEKTAMLILEV